VRLAKLAYILPIVGLVAMAIAPIGPTAPFAANAEAESEADTAEAAQAVVYSAWIVENCTFKDVPTGAFMPDRAYVPGSTNPNNNQVFFQLPVNVGIIKGGNDLVMADTGWKQQQYIQLNNCVNWAPIREQMAVIGFRPEDVTKVVIGHGHWDHAGSIDEFPNATLYVQQAELDGIQFALNYPNPKISETVCGRRPACGYPPEIVDQIYGKILKNQAVIVDGEMEIASGLRIVPAHRAHTNGSQLLAVNTARGQLVFGSDVYSSWEGIRDWLAANIQQTDTVQQFLAYEKCYMLTGTAVSEVPTNCIAAHEPGSYSDAYPITKFWWNIVDASGNRLNCTRAAELSLANGETSKVPANPDRNRCVSVPTTLPAANPETTNPGVPQ
jgi:glyoxylase-like metal-dependent hydrolase (beta-lactamase superfamily II)